MYRHVNAFYRNCDFVITSDYRVTMVTSQKDLIENGIACCMKTLEKLRAFF